MNKKYRHLFFDLDHTLWDFKANSQDTLNDLFFKYGLDKLISNFHIFLQTYYHVNHSLWEYYHNNAVDKETLRYARFAMTLHDFDIDDLGLAKKIADDYLLICPHKGQLFSGAHEVLTELTSAYKLHLITNGFKEVQHIKINASGLSAYFSNVFISEEIGFMKPDRRIFSYAMKKAGAKTSNSIMIGDNIEADINGAAGAGMDTVFFDPEYSSLPVTSNYRINTLNELLKFL